MQSKADAAPVPHRSSLGAVSVAKIFPASMCVLRVRALRMVRMLWYLQTHQQHCTCPPPPGSVHARIAISNSRGIFCRRVISVRNEYPIGEISGSRSPVTPVSAERAWGGKGLLPLRFLPRRRVAVAVCC